MKSSKVVPDHKSIIVSFLLTLTAFGLVSQETATVTIHLNNENCDPFELLIGPHNMISIDGCPEGIYRIFDSDGNEISNPIPLDGSTCHTEYTVFLGEDTIEECSVNLILIDDAGPFVEVVPVRSLSLRDYLNDGGVIPNPEIMDCHGYSMEYSDELGIICDSPQVVRTWLVTDVCMNTTEVKQLIRLRRNPGGCQIMPTPRLIPGFQAEIKTKIRSPFSLENLKFDWRADNEDWILSGLKSSGNALVIPGSEDALVLLDITDPLGCVLSCDRLMRIYPNSIPINTPIVQPELKNTDAYPNPAKNQIRFPVDQSCTKPIEIRNNLGVLIQSFDQTGQHNRRIDISDYPTGQYYIIGASSGRILKFIKK